MPGKAKLSIGGVEQEVELPADVFTQAEIKEKFVPKDFFEGEIQRRVGDARRGVKSPDDLLKDEEFRARATKEWNIGIDAAKVGEQIEAAKTKVLNEIVAPLKQQLGAAEQERIELLQGSLHSKILAAAAAAGVKKSFLTPPVAGGTPPIVAITEQAFKYDKATKQHFVKDGDGYRLSSSPTNEKPYKDVTEFIADWASQAGNKEFIDSQTMDGPGVGNGSRPNAGTRDVVVSRAAVSKDLGVYERAKALAAKQGGDVLWSE